MKKRLQYAKQQPSPASSTSTIDQQEVVYEEHGGGYDSLHAQHQHNQHQAAILQQHLPPLAATPTTAQPAAATTTTTTTTTGGRTKAASASKASPKKPKPKLYNISYKLTPWKSLNHHFLRYSDVKSRPEKRITMSELNSELTQRNGWKAHYLAGQLSDLIQNETETRERIQTLMDLFVQRGMKLVVDLANNCHKLPEQYAALLQSQRSYGKDEFDPELIVSKLDDLLKGEIQRSKLFDDQLRQSRDLILRITSENCEKVPKLTTRFNKRYQL